MGQANIRAVATTPGLTLHSAFDRPGSAVIGRDAGELAGTGTSGVVIGDNAEAALEGADILIDFTAPAVSVLLAELAAPRGLVHVIGTTGCSKEEDWSIQKAGSAGARIVKSGNYSLGINVLLGLVRQAAKDDYRFGTVLAAIVNSAPFRMQQMPAAETDTRTSAAGH